MNEEDRNGTHFYVSWSGPFLHIIACWLDLMSIINMSILVSRDGEGIQEHLEVYNRFLRCYDVPHAFFDIDQAMDEFASIDTQKKATAAIVLLSL